MKSPNTHHLNADHSFARASRPKQQAPLSRRTYLLKAIAEEEPLGPTEVVLDLFQQISPHTPGRKLRRAVEDYLEILGTKPVCIALLKARKTHRRARVGLVNRFRSLCEALIADREAQEEKRIAEYEAQREKRQALLEARQRARAEAMALISRLRESRNAHSA